MYVCDNATGIYFKALCVIPHNSNTVDGSECATSDDIRQYTAWAAWCLQITMDRKTHAE